VGLARSLDDESARMPLIAHPFARVTTAIRYDGSPRDWLTPLWERASLVPGGVAGIDRLAVYGGTESTESPVNGRILARPTLNCMLD
jgi:hypothetical protein